jgi:diketogulonate reductase-like aldo/keto reductase
MKRRGQARAIGVSNFEVPYLEALAKTATKPIVANQCHFALGEWDNVTCA